MELFLDDKVKMINTLDLLVLDLLQKLKRFAIAKGNVGFGVFFYLTTHSYMYMCVWLCVPVCMYDIILNKLLPIIISCG